MPKVDLFAPMSANDYCRHLTRLALSNSDAGRLLNRSARMARAYAHGEFPIPPELAILLRLLVQHVPPRDLDRFRGRPPGRPPAS
jgi:hypothetical protein